MSAFKRFEIKNGAKIDPIREGIPVKACIIPEKVVTVPPASNGKSPPMIIPKPKIPINRGPNFEPNPLFMSLCNP